MFIHVHQQSKVKSNVLFCVYEQVLVNLDEGLAFSLVNKVPEELIFATLSGVNVHFTRTTANEVLQLYIQNIQVSCILHTYSRDHFSNVLSAKCKVTKNMASHKHPSFH